MTAARCRPVGTRGEGTFMTEHGKGGFTEPVRCVATLRSWKTAARDATPIIATRGFAATTTSDLLEESARLDCATDLADIFKTANQLQNATISARAPDSSRRLRTSDETWRETAVAVAFRWSGALARRFHTADHRRWSSHCARKHVRGRRKLAVISPRERGRKIARG